MAQSALIEPLGDDAVDDVVGDEITAIHHFLGGKAHRRLGRDGRAQDVAGRELRDTESLDQDLGLRALAGARRAQKDQPHLTLPPPSRERFTETLILLRNQVALDLSDRIEGHRHHDQQRGAADELADRQLAVDQLGDERHHRQIQRTDDRDAGQHIVDVLGGTLTRADARNEAAGALQVIGRILSG